jgi:2-haloacid dehalogenase
VYKPHPDTYLASIAALGLPPEEVCMVAAHQAELAYAAGLGMQTAFVARPDEFGGPVKPRHPEPGVDYLAAAEVHAEGDWTFVAGSLIDLAEQVRCS